MRPNTLLSASVLLLALTAWAGGRTTNTDPQAPASAVKTQSSPMQQDISEGEKRFSQHCGRCHTPPSSISPRIAKTVLRHMRVRASLSKEDEMYILKFLAPSSEP